MFEPLAATAAASPRFLRLDENGIAVADGVPHAIVRDTTTNLEWPVAYAATEELTHEAAAKACADLRVGGHDDWRMPTRFELESILDLARYSPAIDPALFPGTKSDWHWSSSPDASGADYAWVVVFYFGGVDLNHRDDCAFVRAVRAVPSSQ